jgi:site-specific DNA-methyltransferase (adenine-specific)
MTYQLFNGDCLDFMRTLDAGSVDAIITDLPYGTTACEWDSIIPLAPMWEQVKRVLKRNGVFVTTASQPFASKLIMSNIEWFKYEWIWDKNRAGNFLTAKIMPMISHENILVFSGATVANCAPNNMNYYPQMEKRKNEIKYKKGNDSILYARKNTISIQYTSSQKYPKSILLFNKENGLHPTQKPVALYEYLIRTYTNPGETVLDFCMGSGTTGVAAIQTGRNFIGCDNDTKFGYFAIAEKRIAAASLQPTLFTLDKPKEQATQITMLESTS